MRHFVFRWMITTVAVMVAPAFISGIRYDSVGALIGAALLLGIGMRLACAAGALMVTLMWTASLPPENNLFMDDHIIYALVLIGLALVGAGNTLGLGRWWASTGLVQRFRWLA